MDKSGEEKIASIFVSVHMDAVGAAAPSAAADPGPTHSQKPQGGHF